MLKGFVLGIVTAVVVALAVVFAALPGLSVARKDPPQAEVAVATWLLHHSVPASMSAALVATGLTAALAEAGTL